MHRFLASAAALLLAACVSTPSKERGPRLCHDVYVSLIDPSPAAVEALAAACRTELGHLPGVVSLAVGPRVGDLAREVNDQAFDLALHVVFADRAAHDAYQVAPEHVGFVERHRAQWKAVRVFDSWTAR